MSHTSMQELLSHELSDLYSAENQIVTALELAINQLADEHLKNVLAHHLKETQVHITRLEQVAAENGINLDKKKLCKGMQGILAEAKAVLSEFDNQVIKDAAFALAARRVEHYEMAGYMAAISIVQAADNLPVLNNLDQTLKEEQEADTKLVTLSEETLLKKMNDTM